MALDSSWTTTMDDGVTNAAWDNYDAMIKAEIDSYNTRFASSPGFSKLDWQIVKAVVWIESGGPQKWESTTLVANPVWTSRPMQIGNQGDPGYSVLVGAKEGSSLIMLDDLKANLGRALTDPVFNIKAGVAYLLSRLLMSDIQSVYEDPSASLSDYTVAAGDSLSHIATKVATTVGVLLECNPGVGTLKPGMKLKFRTARMQRVITGWRELNPVNVAQRYNVGDANYVEKLNYVLDLFKKLKR